MANKDLIKELKHLKRMCKFMKWDSKVELLAKVIKILSEREEST